MEIGEVKWYGTYNSKTGKNNDYGFLTPLEGEGDLFFHKSGIVSPYREDAEQIFTEDSPVVYEVREGRKPGKREAFRVRPLSDLAEDERELLYRECRDREAGRALIRLVRSFPELPDREEPDFFLPYLDDWKMRSLFLDRCRAAEPETLWDALGEGILAESVLALFARELPTVFARKEPDFFLPYLDIWEMRSVFLDRCKAVGPAVLLDSLGDRLWKEPVCSLLLNNQNMAWIFAGTDWEDASKENLDRHRRLLSYLEADVFPDASIAIAEAMRRWPPQLPLWWKLFQDSVKVRILIYLSNFGADQANRDAWFTPLREIFQQEERNQNLLLTAVLKFFVNIYYVDAAQRQKNFFEAHNALMTYITAHFTDGTDVTHGLRTLLEPCRNPNNSRRERLFCDGRIWNKENKVFCPQMRRPCGNYETTDLTQTAFRQGLEQGEERYEKQALTDLLLNAGEIPNLRGIEIRERTEYPFRISAFVNGLIRMRPHMKCSQCGELFHPLFRYAKLKTAKLAVTVFSCSKGKEQPAGHDSSVYLNYCYHCHKIIDSRECEFRENGIGITGSVQHARSEEGRGQYLCMYCGGAENTAPGTVCPNCGRSGGLRMKGSGRIICGQCGYDSANFVSEFERYI